MHGLMRIPTLDDFKVFLNGPLTPVAALVLALAASLLIAICWPQLRRARERRRIRRLPPPPVRIVKEPDLKIPRRSDPDRSPPAAVG